MLIDFELAELSMIVNNLYRLVVEDDSCDDPEEMERAISIVEKIAKVTDQPGNENWSMPFFSAGTEIYLESMRITLGNYSDLEKADRP